MKEKPIYKKLRRSYRSTWKYVLCLVPSTFLLILFIYYPRIAVLPMSLYKWSPMSSVKEFVGLHNFEILFTAKLDDTLQYLSNTLWYIGGLFVIQTVLAMILALALQKQTRSNRFFRTYFFLPMVLSSTMISLTWTFMYDPNLGIINNLLGAAGVEGFPGVNFFSENWRAILLIVLVHIWANMGYPIMILTSGLNTVSDDLGEAAKVDGANSWQTFTKITFPLMLPTVFRLSLMTISTGAMSSDYIVMMGSRARGMSFDTWSAYMYKETMNSMDYGRVSAASVLMFVILLIASLIQFFAMRKVEKRILGD